MKKFVAITLILVFISPLFFTTVNFAFEEVKKNETQLEEATNEPKVEEKEDAENKNTQDIEDLENEKIENMELESPKAESIDASSQNTQSIKEEEEEKALQENKNKTTFIASNQAPLLEDGVYKIYSAVDTNKVIDIKNDNVCLWQEEDLQSQKFDIKYDAKKKSYVITALYSDKVFDVSGGNRSDGVNIQTYTLNGTLAQQWEIQENQDKTYTIISKNTTKCIDIAEGKLTKGANIQLYEMNASQAQKFHFKKLEEGRRRANLTRWNLYHTNQIR